MMYWTPARWFQCLQTIFAFGIRSSIDRQFLTNPHRRDNGKSNERSVYQVEGCN